VYEGAKEIKEVQGTGELPHHFLLQSLMYELALNPVRAISAQFPKCLPSH
jgi:hypothetical protein